MTVRYDRATHDSKGPRPGLVALVDHWKRTTGLGSLGIYNYRPVRGGQSLSLHAEGRAADLACNANDARQRRLGDDYANWLTENAEALQVQQFIWNRRSWRPGRGWRAYSGVSPHADHLHVEMNRDGAGNVHPMLGGTAPIEEDDLTPDENLMLQRASHDAGVAKDQAASARVEAQAAKEFAGQALTRLGAVEKALAGLRADSNLARQRDWRYGRLLEDVIAHGSDRASMREETRKWLADLDKLS